MASNGKLSTRRRILEAAFDHFARHGFVGANVRRIAKRAGVSHGTVHWHFGSKTNVYAETVRVAGERFVETIPGLPADTSFRQVAAVWIQHLASDAPVARLLRSLGADHPHPAVRAAALSVNEVLRDYWRQWIRRRQAQGLHEPGFDPTELAHAIVSTLSGMAAIACYGERGPPLTSLVGLSRLIEQSA